MTLRPADFLAFFRDCHGSTPVEAQNEKTTRAAFEEARRGLPLTIEVRQVEVVV